MKWRRVFVLGAVVPVAVLLQAGSASSLSTCTDLALVPRVADLLVSQGAPGYGKLARGKDTVVRAYLTTPDTCTLSATQFITPKSATLAVTNNDGAQPQLTTSALSGNLTASTQVVSPSDPLFLVPKSYVAPTATNADGTAFLSLTLTVTYDRTGATGQTTPTSTKTVSIDKKTNALRILVVPMGDPSNTKTVQWSSAAQTDLQNILTNTARAYPVPSGTGDMSAAATGGIRYVISGALLDVKSLNLYKDGPQGKTKFCGNGSTWSTSQVSTGAFAGHTLKGDLYQRLQDYNRVNNPPADLVLGVADGAIAWKSTDGITGGCDDGRAAVPTAKAPAQVGWVRIAAAGENYPSPVQMEILHTVGIANPNLACCIGYHSNAVESDALGLDKSYNVLQLKPIATASGALGSNDHSIMNYNTTSVPYTKDNTALEARDWTDALCDFGGVDSATATPFANCTLNTAVGTSLGVAAGNTMFGISGTIGANGPRVTNSGIVGGDNTVPIGPGGTGSPLELLACTGDCSTSGNVQHVFPLALFGDEGHILSGIDVAADKDGFGAVVPIDTAWTDFALRYNGSIVYDAPAAGDPDVLKATTDPALLAGFPNAACCNGRAVAFGNGFLYTTTPNNTAIYKLKTDGTLVATINTGVIIGALAYDPANGHLYAGNYSGTGEVYDINPNVIMDGLAQRETLFKFSDPACNNQIDGLAYLPSLQEFAISGDLCDTVFITKKTATPSGDADVLSSFSAGGLNSGIGTDGAGGLWLALPNTETFQTTLKHVDLQGNVLATVHVDFGDEDLDYDAVTFAPRCAMWMNSAGAGTTQVRAYESPCGSSTEQTPNAVTFTATNARYGTAYFTCGDPSNLDDEKFPIVDGLDPVATQGEVQTFSFYFSAMNLSCGEGAPKVLVSVSNGNKHSPLTDVQSPVAVSSSSKSPFASIAAPFGQYPEKGVVHFDAIAWDPEQGELDGDALKWFEGTTQIGTGKSFNITAAGPGPHSVKLDATDAQGHTTSDQGMYLVLYSSGPCLGSAGRTVLQPVDPDDSSVFKKGTTVPVKFRVCDAAGKPIGTPGTVLSTSSPLFKVPPDCAAVTTPSTAATPVFCKNVGTAGAVDEAVVSTAADTSFRWDATNQQWVFNQGTSNLTAGVRSKYYIPLNDGTYIFYVFGTK